MSIFSYRSFVIPALEEQYKTAYCQAKCILSICLLLLSTLMYAQKFQIKGQIDNVMDSEEGTVILKRVKDSTITAKTKINSEGNFVLSASGGIYNLSIIRYGETIDQQKIILNKDINLGLLRLKDVQEVKGVTIEGRRKLIERKVDRLVFNVQNSVASQGMSALDALRNVPLIQIQSDAVSIVGKGNVIIMINDRVLQLSSDQMINYLQSLRSDDIAKIEVITTPPSKYEAEGNSGIINIILKKNQNMGWSGNFNASYQQATYGGFNTGLSLNYQSKKVSSSLKLRQSSLANRTTGTRNLIGDQDAIYTSEARKNQPRSLGFNYAFQYQINDKQDLGFIYDFNQSRQKLYSKGLSRYQRQSVTDSILSTKQTQRYKTPTHTLNAYYELKLDSIGKKLSIIGNFLSNDPSKVNDFTTTNDGNDISQIIRNNSAMKYSIYSGQADLKLPYEWGTFETGIKYTLFRNRSDVGYFNVINSDYILDPSNSNIFNYKENNYAAYISFEKDFSPKWSAKAGLRYEYTNLNGRDPSINKSIAHDKYGKLFPTAYIRYSPNTSNIFTIEYSRRIDRPDFQSLNPFRWYTNPYTYFTGTPTLTPSFSNNLDLSYTFKNTFTTSLYYQHNINGLSNIAKLQDGIYSNTIENSFKESNLGLQLSYNDVFFKRWEFAASATGSYDQTHATIPDAVGLKVYSFAYSLDNTIRLDHDKRFFVMLNFWHTLPYVYANINIKSQLSLTPGIKALFFDKSLTATVVANDVFNLMKSNGYSYNDGYLSEFTNNLDQQIFTFSLSYNFGNKKVKRHQKDIDFDEKTRAQ